MADYPKGNGEIFESPRALADARLSQMKEERTNAEGEWKLLRSTFLPNRGRFTLTEELKRQRVTHRNTTPLIAVRTMGSGMHAGLTSPSRPWQKSTLRDTDLANYRPVKEWLALADTRTMTWYARAGIYSALPFMYPEFGTFGTMAGLLLEDDQTLFRLEPYTVGQYYLAKSDRGVYDTMARELQMTVRQLVSRFGKPGPDGKPDLSRISINTRNAWVDPKRRNEKVEIFHIVEPDGMGGWASCWYETAHQNAPPLKRARYVDNPILAASWESVGVEPYASSCPGMIARGDASALQLDEENASRAMERADNPPMQGPVKAASLIPGSYTQVDDIQLQKGGIRSVYDFRPDLTGRMAKMQRREQRINQAFFVDLFLMLTLDERAQRATAEEIRAKYDEKVLALGPTLEQANAMLRTLHNFVFNLMVRRSMPIWRGVLAGEPLLPEPPAELLREGVEIEPEFISALQQAQRAAALQPLERFMSGVGAVAQLTQKLPDKFDDDVWLDRFADASGVDPSVVRDDDEVAEVRAEQAKMAQMQQLAQMAPALRDAAGAMKDAGDAVPQDGSALQALAGMMG